LRFPSARYCVIIVSMKRQTLITRKRRGPAPTGIGTLIGVRLQPDQLGALDVWIARQEDKERSRPEAIRRMIEMALSGSDPTKHTSPTAAAKASDMAGRRIDKIGDPSATAEERQDRKRRLIKGPSEFREMRGIEPKPKG
jgi:hypothetical protein